VQRRRTQKKEAGENNESRDVTVREEGERLFYCFCQRKFGKRCNASSAVPKCNDLDVILASEGRLDLLDSPV